jgi:hypothetical protein
VERMPGSSDPASLARASRSATRAFVASGVVYLVLVTALPLGWVRGLGWDWLAFAGGLGLLLLSGVTGHLKDRHRAALRMPVAAVLPPGPFPHACGQCGRNHFGPCPPGGANPARVEPGQGIEIIYEQPEPPAWLQVFCATVLRDAPRLPRHAAQDMIRECLRLLGEQPGGGDGDCLRDALIRAYKRTEGPSLPLPAGLRLSTPCQHTVLTELREFGHPPDSGPWMCCGCYQVFSRPGPRPDYDG